MPIIPGEKSQNSAFPQLVIQPAYHWSRSRLHDKHPSPIPILQQPPNRHRRRPNWLTHPDFAQTSGTSVFLPKLGQPAWAHDLARPRDPTDSDNTPPAPIRVITLSTHTIFIYYLLFSYRTTHLFLYIPLSSTGISILFSLDPLLV